MSFYAYAKLFKDADILPYCPNGLKRSLERVFEKLLLPTSYPAVLKECYDINKFFKVPLSHRMTLNEVKGINKSIMLNMYSSEVDKILELGMSEITKEMSSPHVESFSLSANFPQEEIRSTLHGLANNYNP
ncbi:hypothetical protein FQA39_LY04734 [Lamprigera yunnana]|nr:hypothetical protein FQA39_LY04734 [Lamprigera yunnana]